MLFKSSVTGLIGACIVLASCSEWTGGPVAPSSPTSQHPTAARWAVGAGGPETLLPEPEQPAATVALAASAAGTPVRIQAGPSSGFPLVIVRAGPSADRSGAVGAPVVNNFADAVARVASGGTIRVFAGTYTADDVVIDRPLTIEPMHTGARPLIRNQTARRSFRVNGAAPGTVTFRGLDFELSADGRASIQASGVYDQVVVDDCDFTILGEALASGVTGVDAGWTPAGMPTGRTLVNNSRFRGGHTGVFAFGGGRLEVRGSSFGGHNFSGLQYQSGSSGLVEENEVVGCGIYSCARVIASNVEISRNRFEESRTDGDPFFHNLILYSAGATGRLADNRFDGCGYGQCVLVASRAEVEVVGNEFLLPAAHGTRIVIVATDGSIPQRPDFAARAPRVLIVDNVIRGVGGTAAADPTNPDAYAVSIAGIAILNAAVVRAYGNQIENARSGFEVAEWNPDGVAGGDGGNLEAGSDNVTRFVHTGIGIYGSSAVTLNSSDFEDYVTAIAQSGTNEPSDLTCNWWGATTGPVSAWVPDPAVYTPWATSRVAGTSTLSCGAGP